MRRRTEEKSDVGWWDGLHCRVGLASSRPFYFFFPSLIPRFLRMAGRIKVASGASFASIWVSGTSTSSQHSLEGWQH